MNRLQYVALMVVAMVVSASANGYGGGGGWGGGGWKRGGGGAGFSDTISQGPAGEYIILSMIKELHL